MCKFHKVRWRGTFLATLHAGSTMVIPLIIISMLIGVSLALGINIILAPFNLQNQAVFIAQNTIIRDIAPLPIGFVLCVQCGLNLININHPSLNYPAEQVMLREIIPLIGGVTLTAIVLYAYIATSFFVSVFWTFSYLLHINFNEYLLGISDLIYPVDILASLMKTIVYALIASLTAGYYYYDITHKIISPRKAVSRIITRGLFWLIIIAVYIKIYF